MCISSLMMVERSRGSPVADAHRRNSESPRKYGSNSWSKIPFALNKAGKTRFILWNANKGSGLHVSRRLGFQHPTKIHHLQTVRNPDVAPERIGQSFTFDTFQHGLIGGGVPSGPLVSPTSLGCRRGKSESIRSFQPFRMVLTWLTNRSISFEARVLPKAGIDPFPLAMEAASLWFESFWIAGLLKSGTFNCLPTAVAPLPSAAWHEAHWVR